MSNVKKSPKPAPLPRELTYSPAISTGRYWIRHRLDGLRFSIKRITKNGLAQEDVFSPSEAVAQIRMINKNRKDFQGSAADDAIEALTRGLKILKEWNNEEPTHEEA